MSNRNLLKNQNIIDIGDKSDYIDARNYQEFESKILYGNEIQELFSLYDYIIYDEGHYFYADSQFNKNTMILLDPIKNTPKDKIFVFITATPQALLDYQPKYDFVYNMKRNYSYIEDIYFYTRKKTDSTVLKLIIDNIPENEKILFFGSNAQDNLNLSKEFDNSTFICSPSNALSKYSDKRTIDEIINYSKFSSRICFATKFLDNGVNLKDESLSHLFLEILDPITLVQAMGRKRYLSNNDKITLYVKFYNRGNIYYSSKEYKKEIKMVNDYEDMDIPDFQSQYFSKTIDDILIPDYKINEAKLQHYKTQKKLMEKIFFGYDEDKDAYKKYICSLFDFNYSKSKNANLEFEKLTIRQLLEEYSGIKLFEEEQEMFKEKLFNNIFAPKKTDYIIRGIKAARGVIEEDNLKFTISSRREKRGVNRDKYYWIVERI
jgi:hypothetical protein